MTFHLHAVQVGKKKLNTTAPRGRDRERRERRRGGEGAGDAAELGCCCHNWGRQAGVGEGARPFGLQNVNNMALTADIAGLKASCWAALGHAGTKARWGRAQ